MIRGSRLLRPLQEWETGWDTELVIELAGQLIAKFKHVQGQGCLHATQGTPPLSCAPRAVPHVETKLALDFGV